MLQAQQAAEPTKRGSYTKFRRQRSGNEQQNTAWLPQYTLLMLRLGTNKRGVANSNPRSAKIISAKLCASPIRENFAPRKYSAIRYGACTAKVIPYSTVFSRRKFFTDWAYANVRRNNFRESIIIAVSPPICSFQTSAEHKLPSLYLCLLLWGTLRVQASVCGLPCSLVRGFQDGPHLLVSKRNSCQWHLLRK